MDSIPSPTNYIAKRQENIKRQQEMLQKLGLVGGDAPIGFREGGHPSKPDVTKKKRGVGRPRKGEKRRRDSDEFFVPSPVRAAVRSKEVEPVVVTSMTAKPTRALDSKTPLLPLGTMLMLPMAYRDDVPNVVVRKEGRSARTRAKQARRVVRKEPAPTYDGPIVGFWPDGRMVVLGSRTESWVETTSEAPGSYLEPADDGPRETSRRRGRRVAEDLDANIPDLLADVKLPLPFFSKLSSDNVLVSLGTIEPDDAFHTSKFLLPVGYEVHCTLGFRGSDSERFSSSIAKGDDGNVLYRVKSLDKPDRVFESGSSMSAVWREALQAIKGQESVYSPGTSYYGMTNEKILALLEQLPNAEACERYRFRFTGDEDVAPKVKPKIVTPPRIVRKFVTDDDDGLDELSGDDESAESETISSSVDDEGSNEESEVVLSPEPGRGIARTRARRLRRPTRFRDPNLRGFDELSLSSDLELSDSADEEGEGDGSDESEED
jgi:hypothetical protein